jgi:hypothetical protein
MKLALSLAVVLALGGAAIAAADGGKGEMVTVATGKVGGATWTFGIAGGKGERCYGSFTRGEVMHGEVWESYGEDCEPASVVGGEWRDVLQMDVGDGSADLQQTSSRVRSLELLLADPGRQDSHPPEWRRLPTRALSAAQRARAKIGPNFRFAAVSSADPFCVIAVRTFDREHDLLHERSLPCQY